MGPLLAMHGRCCTGAVWVLLRLAVAFDTHQRRVHRAGVRLRGSLRRLFEEWLGVRRLPPSRPFARRRPGWNRTAEHLELKLVRLHVEQPQLGLGQLARVAERVLGFGPARETVRRILLRRSELVAELSELRRKRRRRIRVKGALQLWGIDLTLVWVLGVFPVWLLGVIDYHGSRVVLLQRVGRPSAAAVVAALDRAFAVSGVPARVLTDNAPIFTGDEFGAALTARGVKHSRIRPGHCWTNGRIERLFRTFKETAGSCLWLFSSAAQVDRFCRDFVQWHNRDRPHSSWGGRTPDEVHFGRRKRLRPLGRIDYFDGALHWWRFG